MRQVSIVLGVIISEPKDHYGSEMSPVCTGSGVYRLHCRPYIRTRSKPLKDCFL